MTRTIAIIVPHGVTLSLHSRSWFIGQEMKLPEGAAYHFQMQYGSIGWATGATLGIALGVGM